ncbi:MAG: metal ABC transporter permease [Granulosicoccus sp.]|nr:metal ABC transporter permease [Granulosicoccus sp.]
MFESFVVRAALAGAAVAFAAGPMGCFVVWRRMAYFGDATAHAAILGIALSLAFSQSMFAGTLIVAISMACLVSTLSGGRYAMDTVLGVLAHASLAFGLVAVSLIDNNRVDLNAYLFGDILAVNMADILIMWIGAVLVVSVLTWRWSALLTATLNPELAYASGTDPRIEQLLLAVSLALVVAVSIKVVGVLLITAMLIIPAAAARPVSESPEQMALMAIMFGLLASIGGLYVSYMLDIPTGPSIVCVAAVLFAATNLIVKFRQQKG